MSRVYAEAAAAALSRPITGTPRQEERLALAALIPHPYLPGRHDCTACGLHEAARIHHWDDARSAA